MIKISHLIVLLLSLASCNSLTGDYLIENGTVYDGLGNPPMEANLLIRNGKIMLLDQGQKAKAPHIIDASGLAVSPGFIDVHNHSDRGMSDSLGRFNEGFIRQGVTTIVGGPDGYLSPNQIRALIETYKKQGIGTNVAFYVGHNGIRKEVMKDDQQRPPSTEELEQMKALVREGMEMGAIGLSTGLMYDPGSFSDTEEVIALSREVHPYGGIYDSHVRNPVHEFIKSQQEVIDIAKAANIPGKLGHLKAVGLHNKGAISEIIAMVEAARNDGLNIVADQYPYDGAQTSPLEWIIVIPDDIVKQSVQDSLWEAGLYEDLLKEKLSQPALREALRLASENGVNGGFAWLKATGYSSMRITASEDHPELVGKYLSEIAEERQIKNFDLVCDLILSSEQSIRITLGGIDEADVRELLVQPWNMIASDGAYVKASEASGGHPRSTGTFPRVLGHYVRELNLLSLEEAIRKMTSLPADVIGLPDRGKIQEGLMADIVLFDPETIIDHSTFEQPNMYSTGVVYVFVNGKPVLYDGEMTGEVGGEYLKRQSGR